MILILSQEDEEVATDIVVEYLLKKKANFIRINGEDLCNCEYSYSVSKSHLETSLKVNSKVVKIDEINVVWYRRWNTYKHLQIINKNRYIGREATGHAVKDLEVFSDFLYTIIPKKAHWLTRPSLSEDNKIITLDIASKCGLKIPKFLISNNRRDVQSFYDECGSIIIKPMANSGYFKTKKNIYSHYAERISQDDILGMSNMFIPTHFQEEIKRKLELRIFFLGDEYYAVALFQNKDQNHPDIKQHHANKTLRRIPYRLPTEVKNNLEKLMNEININTGSIDMIVDAENNYYFIEVNPIGIFSDSSYFCNLGLEEKIADYLMKIDNNTDDQNQSN